MRKLPAILILIILLLSMAACGSREAEIPEDVQAGVDLALESLTAGDSSATGGWTRQENTTLTDAETAAFENAVAAAEEELELERKKTHTEAAQEEAESVLTPLALEATQVVSGVNYCFLCKGESPDETAPSDETEYFMVYIYRDVEGNAEITDCESLNP